MTAANSGAQPMPSNQKLPTTSEIVAQNATSALHAAALGGPEAVAAWDQAQSNLSGYRSSMMSAFSHEASKRGASAQAISDLERGIAIPFDSGQAWIGSARAQAAQDSADRQGRVKDYMDMVQAAIPLNQSWAAAMRDIAAGKKSGSGDGTSDPSSMSDSELAKYGPGLAQQQANERIVAAGQAMTDANKEFAQGGAGYGTGSDKLITSIQDYVSAIGAANGQRREQWQADHPDWVAPAYEPTKVDPTSYEEFQKAELARKKNMVQRVPWTYDPTEMEKFLTAADAWQAGNNLPQVSIVNQGSLSPGNFQFTGDWTTPMDQRATGAAPVSPSLRNDLLPSEQSLVSNMRVQSNMLNRLAYTTRAAQQEQVDAMASISPAELGFTAQKALIDAGVDPARVYGVIDPAAIQKEQQATAIALNEQALTSPAAQENKAAMDTINAIANGYGAGQDPAIRQYARVALDSGVNNVERVATVMQSRLYSAFDAWASQKASGSEMHDLADFKDYIYNAIQNGAWADGVAVPPEEQPLIDAIRKLGVNGADELLRVWAANNPQVPGSRSLMAYYQDQAISQSMSGQKG